MDVSDTSDNVNAGIQTKESENEANVQKVINIKNIFLKKHFSNFTIQSFTHISLG